MAVVEITPKTMIKGTHQRIVMIKDEKAKIMNKETYQIFSVTGVISLDTLFRDARNVTGNMKQISTMPERRSITKKEHFL